MVYEYKAREMLRQPTRKDFFILKEIRYDYGEYRHVIKMVRKSVLKIEKNFTKILH